MSQEMQEMVEHIDQATSPEQRSIRAFISQNLHFMGWDGFNNPLFAEGIKHAETLGAGQGIEFLKVATGPLVQGLLEEVEKGKNVSAYADRTLDSLKERYPETFVRIVAGFIWKQGQPDQFIDPAMRAILEKAFTGTIERITANIIFTQFGGRTTVLN